MPGVAAAGMLERSMGALRVCFLAGREVKGLGDWWNNTQANGEGSEIPSRGLFFGRWGEAIKAGLGALHHPLATRRQVGPPGFALGASLPGKPFLSEAPKKLFSPCLCLPLV